MLRKDIINKIIRDLEQIRRNSPGEYSDFAISQLITFFKSSKTVINYISWLLVKAPKINPNLLLEINDFPFTQYEVEMHEQLIKAERKRFPGLIELLVATVSKYILSQNKDICILSLGSGGMEVERQILERVIKSEFKHKLTFIGDDYSEGAHQVAQMNLSTMQNVEVLSVEHLDNVILGDMITKSKQFSTILCRNDIFTLAETFPAKRFDVVMHTLFRHHLTTTAYDRLSTVIRHITRRSYEYDGYRSWVAMIPQTIMGWKSPVFLNAEIFSNLRFMKKSEVLTMNNGKLTLTPIGYYLHEVQY